MVAVDSYRALAAQTEKLLKEGQLKQRFITQTFSHGKTWLETT
jgi:hypothetical protein